MSESTVPDWCCASGCRHCPAYRSQLVHPKAKVRRDALRAAGRCINSGPRSKVEHGPVTSAGKCSYCVAIHRGSRGKGGEKGRRING